MADSDAVDRERICVHHRAIGAPEVLQPDTTGPDTDAQVSTTHTRVVDAHTCETLSPDHDRIDSKGHALPTIGSTHQGQVHDSAALAPGIRDPRAGQHLSSPRNASGPATGPDQKAHLRAFGEWRHTHDCMVLDSGTTAFERRGRCAEQDREPIGEFGSAQRTACSHAYERDAVHISASQGARAHSNGHPEVHAHGP